MQSFRSEIENPIVEQDILELERKIAEFKLGKLDEERFRSLRLARGVYGQRQHGVQMIRIKIPYGKLNARKLRRIADVSDEYSRGRLHITTRQDIQIHHVSLDRTPELWAELEKDQITLREACGNTVRNVTASETSGIDPAEPFDPRLYADAVFKYFLRNPICQEMGRKFKISFSNTEKDTALAYMHDVGLIAKVNSQGTHGFKVIVGGGLGSQSIHGHLWTDFIAASDLIPLIEAILRVFERHGERSRRMKARLKFLIQAIGFDTFRTLVEDELKGIDTSHPLHFQPENIHIPVICAVSKVQNENYEKWKTQNVIKQKDGNFAIGVKVGLGDFYTHQARQLADWMEAYSGDELTLTINQNFIIRHVPEKALSQWYDQLLSIGLGDIGFNTLSDITACPGTDTCNLGIASSTGLASKLEEVIAQEFPKYIEDPLMNIKISGCMNSCGQHMISTIGFQGMSMKTKDKRVLPAAQVLLGGGTLGDGQGRFADKIIKIPAKRTPKALRLILNDFENQKFMNEHYLNYYDRKGQTYFYDMLKPLGSVEALEEDELIDWGHDKPYIKAIGVGECAGVVIDLITTLFFESEDKLDLAKKSLASESYKDSIYHSYASLVNTAKALLLAEDQKTNTHIGIINGFQEQFIDPQLIEGFDDFSSAVLKMKQETQSEDLASFYYNYALAFYKAADSFRLNQLQS